MKTAILNLLLAITLVTAIAAVAVAQPGAERKSDQPAVVRGNSEFALSFYGRLAGQEGNLFFSPYSLSTALAMTYAGARGETAAEMARVLHYPADQAVMHPSYRELIQQLNGYGLPRDYQLCVSNALWGGRGQFLPEFLKTTRANYGAGLRNVNFAYNPDEARATINKWVENQTHDKIKDLLKPGDVDRSTELVLTNTIYFKATWEHQFTKAATQVAAEFHVDAAKTVPVPLMQQTQSLPYFDAGKFQALALPYEGRDLQMLVLLPKAGSELAALEKELTLDKLNDCIAKLSPQRVAVSLPRFKVTARVDAGDILASMGMSSCFTPAADFSGMSNRRKLCISKIVHQAFVDVDEEGTEAAAATAVVMMRAGAPVDPPIHFKADHPFLFLIRDAKTNSILFMGRLQNPKT